MKFVIRDNNPTGRQPKTEEDTIAVYFKEKNGEVFIFGVDSNGRVDKLARLADGQFYLRPDNGLEGLILDTDGYVVVDEDVLDAEPELTGRARVDAALDELKAALAAL